ncbi:MAG TPA: hypothetical protein VEI94_16625 [Candidatus Bathyarchaeia archaeon]|nr:hypothetical protein [Candidatus Bathyarchaeia archaeon]
MAEKKISKTARASTRGKVTLKAWHVSRETGKAVSRVKLVNHMIDGKPTTRFGWVGEDGEVLLDHQVEYRFAEGARPTE